MENERNLMTTTEAARYLGLKPSYLYKMMMRRAIPYYKPNGKLCFFAKEDLDAWLKRVRVKSQDEIDSEAARPAPVRAQGTAPLPQYTDYRPGTVPYRIGDDRESPGYFIPDEALKVFDEEFDYRETANSRELTDRAVALFVGMMSAQAAPSGGGGGGSSDLPWGRREDEDDREWARRCAREAERMIGRKPKTGRKR